MSSATTQKKRYFVILAIGGTLVFLGTMVLSNMIAATVTGLGFVIWLIATGAMYRGDLSRKDLLHKYADDNSRFMDIDGMAVHYQVEGDGEPLVLIHGTIGSIDEWSDWTRELSHKYRVIRMDIPGFGLTGPNQENRYTSKVYVEFLAKFADRMGLERFHLGGNSLGGHIAWSFAAAHADRVQSLILVGPSGLPPGPNLWSIDLANTPVVDRLMEKCTPEFFFRMALNQAYGDAKRVTSRLVKRHYELTRRHGNRKALISHFKTVRQDHNIDDLSRITAPTLILWGKEDKVINWAGHETFAQRIANVTIKPFERVGHMVIKEIPAQSAEEAAKFMDENAMSRPIRRAA